MALPADYNLVEVRGRYTYLDGTANEGTVTFTGKLIAVSDSTKTVIIPTTLTAELQAGVFTINLPATDDPDILPNSWTYTVVENFTRGGGRTFEMDVPLAAIGTGIDIADVAPTTPDSGDPTAFVTLTAFASHTHGGGGGGTGDVTGPASSTDNTIARYNGGTGKIIQGSGVVITDTNDITSYRQMLRTFSSDFGADYLDRIDLNYLTVTTDMDLFRVYVNGVLVRWDNENGFLRGTPASNYKDDAIVRGRARSDLTGSNNGGYIELENSSSQILHRRRWRDGALVRGDGTGASVVCADTIVLNSGDPVPAGTPVGTVIVRLV